jgi:DNA modification methylase
MDKKVDDDAKLKVEYWPIGRVLSYARNSRLHSDAQIEAIAASIKEFGFVNPCLVDDDGVLIAGHGRVLAMRKLERDAVPVIRLGHLTELQAKALRIADNQLPTLATWDADMLRMELTDLQAAGYEMPLLGFDDVQLVSFMANVPTGQDPEATPEPPEKPISRAGDLWQLGKHRLLCGDSTNGEDVKRLLGGDIPKLLVTDPPYGVSFERGKFVGRKKAAKGQVFAPIAGDELRGKALTDFIAKVINNAFEDRYGVFYLWSAFHEGYSIYAGMADAGIKIQSQLIWKKTPFVIGRADYHWQHEVCWYGFKGANHPWYGGRDKGTVWDIPKAQKMENHPTQKPIDCMRIPIENSSQPGEWVYEPFAGSGTTIVACEMVNRCCLAVELSPAYVDVCVQRWQTFAKAEAVLAGDGRTFAEVSKARKRAPVVSTGARRKAKPAEAAE